MTYCDPPYKTLFFVCYSTVAAIVATEAGLLSKHDTSLAELSHQEFVEEFDRYLADNEDHPWCGTGRLDDAEVGYLAPDGDGGVQFINEEAYEKLLAEGLQEA
jgi:hypothetical protein